MSRGRMTISILSVMRGLASTHVTVSLLRRSRQLRPFESKPVLTGSHTGHNLSSRDIFIRILTDLLLATSVHNHRKLDSSQNGNFSIEDAGINGTSLRFVSNGFREVSRKTAGFRNQGQHG